MRVEIIARQDCCSSGGERRERVVLSLSKAFGKDDRSEHIFRLLVLVNAIPRLNLSSIVIISRRAKAACNFHLFGCFVRA